MAKIVAYLESVAYAVIILVVLSFFLSGCASTKPEVKIEYVTIAPKEPPIIPRPDLDTDYLKPGMDAGTVISLHRLTIIKLQGYALQLENALSNYAAPIQGK